MSYKHQFYFFFRQASPFSNWHIRPFTIKGISFNCVEQWMMYSKAMLFGDTDIAELILKEPVPRKQKKLGRRVKGFIPSIWYAQREKIVAQGIDAKFDQHPKMTELLLSIDAKEFVEASPYDGVWGVKLAMDDPRIQDKAQWQGLNLLGKLITRKRNRLKGNDMVDPAEGPTNIIIDLTQSMEQFAQQSSGIVDFRDYASVLTDMVAGCITHQEAAFSQVDYLAANIMEDHIASGDPEVAKILHESTLRIGHDLIQQLKTVGAYDEVGQFDLQFIGFAAPAAAVFSKVDPVGENTKENLSQPFKKMWPYDIRISKN